MGRAIESSPGAGRRTERVPRCIVTSNLWSLILREWKGADRGAVRLLVAGNLVIVASTGLIGWGNYLSTHAGN